MTSDGITKEDWDLVENHIRDMCELSGSDISSEFLEKKLMHFLNELISKYGRLPSLLVTIASFTLSTEKKIILYKEAYVTALEMQDDKNISLVAGDIAECYFDEVCDYQKGSFWLKILIAALENYSDDILSELKIDLESRKVTPF